MESSKSHKRKILLVDDDPNLLETVGQFLKLDGYDVIASTSGEDAFEKLATLHPHLIILDMSMPGMGGVGFLQRITGADGKPQYPVLVLTARAQMAEFFANMEVDGFIAKPADPDDLSAEVGRILFLRGNEDSEFSGSPNHEVPLHRIVLGDQDALQSSALQVSLEAAGYSVEVASSGPVVLELAISGKPEAIVVRSDLAQLDAPSLLQLFRKMPSLCGVPVVVYGADHGELSMQTDDLTLLVGDSDPDAVLAVVAQLF